MMIDQGYSPYDGEDVIDVEQSRRRGKRWVAIVAVCIAVAIIAAILLFQVALRANAAPARVCTLGATPAAITRMTG